MAGGKSRVVGAKAFTAKLRRLTPDAVRQLTKAVEVIASQVQTDAQISITTGAVSGKGHVPSAPGEPPNNDTGGLVAGIVVNVVAPLHRQVASTARYAAAQELGNSRLPERPYMRPAVAKNREGGQKLFRAAVSVVSKGGKL